MARNKFKFFCVDCGAEQMLQRHMANRRSRPHCLECGSTFLEPKTADGWNRIADGETAHTEQTERVTALVGKRPKANRDYRTKRRTPPQGSR